MNAECTYQNGFAQKQLPAIKQTYYFAYDNEQNGEMRVSV